MAEIIPFKRGGVKMNDKAPVHKQIDSLDDSAAFLIEQSIQDIKRVNDPTRTRLARNLGEILSQFGRTQLHLGDMMALALDTQNVKAVERLGRFRIKPGKEPTASTLKNLSHKLHDYVSIVNATAALTGESRTKLAVQLFNGTRFSKFEESDGSAQTVEEQLSKHLNRYATFIFEKYRVQEYFTGARRYNAEPTGTSRKEREKTGKNYTFKVNHDGWKSSSFPEIRLFSIIRSISDGLYWHTNEEGDVPSQCEKEECVIVGLETVSLGIYPIGNSNQPNLVFASTPTTGVLIPSRNFSQTFDVIPDQLGIWKYLPLHKNRSFYESLKSDPAFSRWHGNGYKDQIEKALTTPSRFGYDHFFQVKEKLDLSWIANEWDDIGGDQELAHQVYYGQSRFKLSKKVQRVSPSSIRNIFNLERSDVMTCKWSAFNTRFDTSRAISSPATMLAELEINLWYEGYNTTFDDSEQKYWATMDDYEWEIDDDGNEYRREFQRQPFEDTILERLEKHTEELSDAYFDWRQEITLDIRERSRVALEITEAKLKELRSSKKKD